MNKKWVASTAVASVLAAIGISSNTAHVHAAVTSNDDNNDNQDQDSVSSTKDASVASVMDTQGAPLSDATADAIDSANSDPNTTGTSVLERSAATALTQATTTSTVTSAQQQAFLATAVPMAQKASSEYKVYTSVMLAQAILESGWGQSGLATQAHNLFGIKGSYNGSYLSMPTSEWDADKGWYTIYANFAKYPSYYESFADNGNKLRNGVSWDSSFYSGTWKENCSSYKDATAWLQGRYATAPTYASILNNLIETYNLTQYDGDASTGGASDNNSGDNTNEQINGTVTKTKDVATVTNKKSAMLYLYANPDQSANRALGYGTSWAVTAKVVTPSGQVYYKVSSTEYVKAEDVQLKSVESTVTTNPPVSISDSAIVIKNAGTKVYSSADKSTATGRVLPYQSAWITTKYVTNSNNEKFYFVGTNSYISADDVELKSEQANEDYKSDVITSYPDIVHVTATPSAKVYDDKHRALAISLLNNTDWKIDKKSTHSDGTIWYRVATGQWVSANDVQVKGSNYIKTVSGSVKINYIPGYGVNVYNSPAANNKFTGTRLADGTTWQVTSQQIVDGQTWYKVSSGWVNGKYCIYTAN
ncbi:glycoside hydrolase family 73 protein [Companilactobacillus allii]|uniref:Mannosyl-glycoprotein endo-beta-N-acetylglucosamidase-like domain-containing protein n=1 Tax=Companilactobacillus allii TaxID=1847728 RepID=A0A1P8Q262_9LACO|nr:glycoside hydrolase family 73 protein [Companilactobacillus allii]APX71925.1 hypothetical protein BTM29_04860 [Companilactobacillus allii]USQ69019.1 glycoside hydrolase family 73 protein [Companilactobacillus allii]